jgi:hypothetical protein
MLRRTQAMFVVVAIVVVGGAQRGYRTSASPACTVEAGQLLIDQGDYLGAIDEFSCVIAAQPTEVEGYQGRIERGGGAATDLLALNDYRMARAICASPVPVFTALGHESDATLLDTVANRAFGTPSVNPTPLLPIARC